jgi:hypothetical protein
MITIEEISTSSPMRNPVKKYIVTTPDDDAPPVEEISKMRLLSEVCLLLSKEENIRTSTSQHRTLREAVYEAASNIDSPFTTGVVLNAVREKGYYDFSRCKTPKASVSSVLSQDEKYLRVDFSTYKINPKFIIEPKRKFKEHADADSVNFPPKKKHLSEFKQEKQKTTKTMNNRSRIIFPRPPGGLPVHPLHLYPLHMYPSYTGGTFNRYHVAYQSQSSPHGIYAGSYF